MAINYKEAARGLPKVEAEKYSHGIALVGNFVDSLQRQGLLPKRFAQAQEATTRTEVTSEPLVFSDEARTALIQDGAVIYFPTGETINDQKAAERPFWYIADGFKVNGRNRLTEFPSRRIEVAIYPDTERFFVPNSFNKTTDQQLALLQQDTETLRTRLGRADINQILPEASEATEVFFKHFEVTDIRLLGKDYIRDGCWSYMRTSTPTNKEGSRLADVGHWYAGIGLDVLVWHRGESFVYLGVARWVVPQGAR